MTAEKDYILRTVRIEDGAIACLENCAVPRLDDGALSYTVAEKTGVTSNKPGGAAAGELIMIRAFYEMDASKNAEAERLQLVLPDGIQLIEYSVLLDGQTAAYSYDENERTLSVNVSGRTGAVLYLYCTAASAGLHSVGAFLTLTSGAVQPIGTAAIRAENALLNVAEKTGVAKGLIAAGKTVGGATVSLYDNDTPVGTAKANSSGSWSITFDLAEPVYSYSYHNIYAKISGGYLSEPITTERKLVTYNSEWAEQLKKITMYNTGDHGAQETVFDFTAPNAAAPYYRAWPSAYPTFTFKAEFAEDASELKNVDIVTTNSAGEKTYVETAYDPDSGAWVGTHNYTSFNQVPVQVGAAWDGEENTVAFDGEKFSDALAQYMTISEAIEDAVSEDLKAAYGCGEPEISEDGRSVRMNLTCTDPDTGETEVFGVYSLTVEALEETAAEDTLEAQGYIRIDNAQIWSKSVYDDHSFSTIYVDLEERSRYIETMEDSGADARVTASADGWEASRNALGFLANFTPCGFWTDLANLIGDSVVSQSTWRTELKGNQEVLLDKASFIRESLLEAVCKDTGERRLSDADYARFQLEVDRLEEQINEYRTEGQSLLLKAAVSNTCVWGVKKMIMKVPHSHSEQLVNAGKNVKAALFELLSQYTADRKDGFGGNTGDLVTENGL